MNTATITEGTKFAITGMLEGQAGRKFIKGKVGIVTEVKIIKGSKSDTTMVSFKMEKNTMNMQFGGVCEIEKFIQNVSII